MEIKIKNTLGAFFEFDGYIYTEIETSEFKYLLEMFHSGEKAEGILKEFGFNGAVMVVDMEMLPAKEKNNAKFFLKSVPLK